MTDPTYDHAGPERRPPTAPDIDDAAKTLPQTKDAGILPPSPDVGLPAPFAHFQLLALLPGGVMGEVYYAYDCNLFRHVCVKRVRVVSEVVEAHFLREARAQASLHHPNVGAIYELEQHGGYCYFSMPYIRGGNLEQGLSRFVGDARAAVALVVKVARGVHHGHTSGILHRDLKPSNILLTEAGEPVLIDFGLAAILDDDAPRDGEGPVGTPAYMAPEQTLGQRGAVGPAADIWSLGVVLYELLTGQRPFLGGWAEVMERIRKDEPPTPRSLRPDIDSSLETMCLRCLAKDPEKRYPTADALADALERWLADQPATPPAPAPWQADQPLALPAASWRHRLVRDVTAWANRPLARVAAFVLFSLLLWAAVAALPSPAPPPPPDETAEARARAALADHHRRLAAGQQVVLVGHDVPAWSRWLGDKGTLNKPTPDEPTPQVGWTLAAAKLSRPLLLELLDDPKTTRYRFQADVRLISAAPGAHLGLFLGRIDREAGEARGRGFLSLTYDDTTAPRPNPDPRGPAAFQVRFGPVLESFPQGRLARYKSWHERTAATPAGWRRLVAEVTPEKVAFRWTDLTPQGESHAAEATWEQLAKQSNNLTRGFQVGEVAAVPAPRGGLGLHCYNASYTFRDVVVTPLP